MADPGRSQPAVGADQVRERAAFLRNREPFTGLSQGELERVAASIVERAVPAGGMVLVESGLPGTELYVVRDGTFELTYKQAVVAILTSGEVFGHPTLLTGLSPEFTHHGQAGLDALLHPE